MDSTLTDIKPELKFKNRIILQIICPHGAKNITYCSSVKEVQRKLENNIPYSALINIYYICSNKGGGLDKKSQKKHVHKKYVNLLKTIRIFDENNNELIDDDEYFNKLIKN
jgi:hypothetical protein